MDEIDVEGSSSDSKGSSEDNNGMDNGINLSQSHSMRSLKHQSKKTGQTKPNMKHH